MKYLSAESMALALKSLTSREHEVKNLVVQGLANKVIAAELGISQRTIEAHRARVFSKLQVRNAVELAHVLLVQRLAEPTTPFQDNPPLPSPTKKDPK